MTERVDAKAVLALSVYEVKSEHMEWCHACLRWTVDGHSETCLAGALQQTLADLSASEQARQRGREDLMAIAVLYRAQLHPRIREAIEGVIAALAQTKDAPQLAEADRAGRQYEDALKYKYALMSLRNELVQLGRATRSIEQKIDTALAQTKESTP